MKTVDLNYSQLKTIVTSKGLLLQYKETANQYELFAVEANVSWETVILKNSDDATDFETNLKSTANAPLEYRSIDGLPKVASAKFADVKSFLAIGTNGVVSLTGGTTSYAKWHFDEVFTLSGVDISWWGSSLGDYIDFEVGFYIDESDESTFQSVNKFGDHYKIYKDGNRSFDVPAVKDIPSTVSGFNIHIRAKCVNTGALPSTVIINLVGWH
jgi:hypothetical protein